MSYAVAKNSCQSCQKETKVYFEGDAPKVGEVYRYVCEGCGGTIYFMIKAGAVLVNGQESIPEGAAVAEKKKFL